MAFDYLMPTQTPRRRASDPDRSIEMYRDELAERAGLYYRLGFPPSRAIARLAANVAWDFEHAHRPRPTTLSDKSISDIVKSTYLRRPAR